MLSKGRLITLGTLALTLIISGYLYYDFTKEVDGKTFREWHSLRSAAFKKVRAELRPMTDMTKGDVKFSQEVVRKQSVLLNDAAKALPNLLSHNAPSGDASAAIWKSDSDFKLRLKAFIAKTTDLAQSPPKSLDQLTTQIEALQTDCTNCHKRFKD